MENYIHVFKVTERQNNNNKNAKTYINKKTLQYQKLP